MEPSATGAAERPRGGFPEGRLLTVKEVAARLGCDKALVYRLVEREELPALQLGGRGCSLRIAEADLDDWLYAEPGDAA